MTFNVESEQDGVPLPVEGAVLEETPEKVVCSDKLVPSVEADSSVSHSIELLESHYKRIAVIEEQLLAKTEECTSLTTELARERTRLHSLNGEKQTLQARVEQLEVQVKEDEEEFEMMMREFEGTMQSLEDRASAAERSLKEERHAHAQLISKQALEAADLEYARRSLECEFTSGLEGSKAHVAALERKVRELEASLAAALQHSSSSVGLREDSPLPTPPRGTRPSSARSFPSPPAHLPPPFVADSSSQRSSPSAAIVPPHSNSQSTETSSSSASASASASASSTPTSAVMLPRSGGDGGGGDDTTPQARRTTPEGGGDQPGRDGGGDIQTPRRMMHALFEQRRQKHYERAQEAAKKLAIRTAMTNQNARTPVGKPYDQSIETPALDLSQEVAAAAFFAAGGHEGFGSCMSHVSEKVIDPFALHEDTVKSPMKPYADQPESLLRIELMKRGFSDLSEYKGKADLVELLRREELFRCSKAI